LHAQKTAKYLQLQAKGVAHCLFANETQGVSFDCEFKCSSEYYLPVTLDRTVCLQFVRRLLITLFTLPLSLPLLWLCFGSALALIH
jgi:hypothetical protein